MPCCRCTGSLVRSMSAPVVTTSCTGASSRPTSTNSGLVLQPAQDFRQELLRRDAEGLRKPRAARQRIADERMPFAAPPVRTARPSDWLRARRRPPTACSCRRGAPVLRRRAPRQSGAADSGRSRPGVAADVLPLTCSRPIDVFPRVLLELANTRRTLAADSRRQRSDGSTGTNSSSSGMRRGMKCCSAM